MIVLLMDSKIWCLEYILFILHPPKGQRETFFLFLVTTTYYLSPWCCYLEIRACATWIAPRSLSNLISPLPWCISYHPWHGILQIVKADQFSVCVDWWLFQVPALYYFIVDKHRCTCKISSKLDKGKEVKDTVQKLYLFTNKVVKILRSLLDKEWIARLYL